MNLPYVFDLLYDLKTLEQLHDHLAGKARQPVSSTDAEVIETCIDYNIPLPDNLITTLDTNEKLTNSIGRLSTLIDIRVAEKALEKAQNSIWENTIKPMFADCKTREDAKVVMDKISEMIVDNDGKSIGIPAHIELKIASEISGLPRAYEASPDPST